MFSLSVTNVVDVVVVIIIVVVVTLILFISPQSRTFWFKRIPCYKVTLYSYTVNQRNSIQFQKPHTLILYIYSMSPSSYRRVRFVPHSNPLDVPIPYSNETVIFIRFIYGFYRKRIFAFLEFWWEILMLLEYDFLLVLRIFIFGALYIFMKMENWKKKSY